MKVTNRMNGFLLVDKPEGLSSFGVVGRVRKLLNSRKNSRKTGHCGTLDPLATGLLIVCLGKATKLSRFILGSRKSYQATITLGGTTDTYDREGVFAAGDASVTPTLVEIESALKQLTGRIMQKPPIYSALKVKGKPLYKYARKSEDVEVEPREVLIESIALINYVYPTVSVVVTCGAGTYIRSLAHDLGEMLGCGGYLEELRRTCIGDSVVENAITLERLAEVARSDGESPGDSNGDHGDLRAELGKSFIEIGEMIKLPAITVVSDRLSQVEHGVPLRAEDITAFDAEISVDQLVALRADSGDLLAIARALYAARELPDDPQEQLVEYVRVI